GAPPRGESCHWQAQRRGRIDRRKKCKRRAEVVLVQNAGFSNEQQRGAGIVANRQAAATGRASAQPAGHGTAKEEYRMQGQGHYECNRRKRESDAEIAG